VALLDVACACRPLGVGRWLKGIGQNGGVAGERSVRVKVLPRMPRGEHLGRGSRLGDRRAALEPDTSMSLTTPLLSPRFHQPTDRESGTAWANVVTD
jgi:hypothetical protein